MELEYAYAGDVGEEIKEQLEIFLEQESNVILVSVTMYCGEILTIICC